MHKKFWRWYVNIVFFVFVLIMVHNYISYGFPKSGGEWFAWGVGHIVLDIFAALFIINLVKGGNENE